MSTNVQPARFTSCGFLYNPKTQSVFLHLRDNKTLFFPDCWAFFGGRNEGEETPEACYAREMKEEIDFHVQPDNIHFLRSYLYSAEKGIFNIFYSLSEQPREDFHLGEGADCVWVPLKEVRDLKLADYAKDDLDFFIDQIAKQRHEKV